MSDDPRKNPHADDDLVPEDDAIIGRALKRSLATLGAVAAVVIAIVLLMRLTGGETVQEIAIEPEAPVAVRETVTPPELPFADVTAEAGVDFVHTSGAAGDKLLPETMGSGAAFFDLEDDGDQDLLLIDGDAWPASPTPSPVPRTRLYRNDGAGGSPGAGASVHFTDVTDASGLGVRLYGTGVAIADVDGDGRRDVFIAALGRNRLFRGTASGRFADVTESAGVAGGDRDWSTSAGFFDADGDGDLDLFVCNYVVWSREIDLEVDYRLTGVGRAYGPPVNYQGTHSALYRNEGDGTFTDVSAEAGIRIHNPATGVPVAKALALAIVDVDRDGHPDVFVANDTVGNFLFHNLGDGTFEEIGQIAGVAFGRAGEATGAMGVDAGFLRDDDRLGLIIGNFANEMTSVYVSQGTGGRATFLDEAISEGIGAPSRTLLTFGELLLDLDLDGRLDLLQTNGHLEEEIGAVDPSQTYEQPSQVFWNAGLDARTTFVAVDPEATGDLARPIVGRGSATADVDGDGDLDVVLTQTGRRPLLLRNDQRLGHHWLRLWLVDEVAPDRDALGARLELEAGGRLQRRTVAPTRSYLSQSELPVTFGLGAAAAVDGLRVVWPDGETTAVEVVGGVDRFVKVRRTESGVVVEPVAAGGLW